MSLSEKTRASSYDTEAQIEDLKHEREKFRAQYLATLKKLRRKADVERDNDDLRKENERLRKDLEDARERALRANDDATDMWGQKEAVEDENRDLKRLVARLQHRLEELTLSRNRAQVKVEKALKPAIVPTPSPSLRSHSTAPEVINLIDDDDDDDMVVDTYPPRRSIGTPSSTMTLKSEPLSDIVRSIFLIVTASEGTVDVCTHPIPLRKRKFKRKTRRRRSHAGVGTNEKFYFSCHEMDFPSANTGSEDEFDPNNMETELIQQESNHSESPRLLNRSVSPQVTKSVTRFFNPRSTALDEVKDFDISNVQNIGDDQLEDVRRTKRMRQITPPVVHSSGNNPENSLHILSKGKRKATPQPLGDKDYLSQIENAHLKNAVHYTIHPPPPDGFYVPRVFIADTYGGSAYQFLQTLKTRNIKCVWPKKCLNPLVVDAPGAPGLMFASRLEIVESKPWHVFGERQVEKQTRWEYMGKYESIVSGRIEAEEFAGQSEEVKTQWGKLLLSSKKADVYVAMRARIALRKHDLSVDDDSVDREMEAITKKMRKRPVYKEMTKDEKRQLMKEIKARKPLAITAEEIVDAFCSGDEHIKILRMECVDYDHAFVKDMQEKLPHWKPKSEATGQKTAGRVPESETEDDTGPTPLRRTPRQRKRSIRLRELINEEQEDEEEGEPEDEGENSDGDSDYEY